MSQAFDASRSLTALEQDSTIIAVIEMSQAKWLVAGIVPGVERQPLKRLTADEAALLKLLHRWRNEAGQAGRQHRQLLSWMRLTTPRSSRQAAPPAIDDLYSGYRPRRCAAPSAALSGWPFT